MFKINGKRVSGTGTATSNLVTQFPAIKKEFPEVANCHLGTINLKLEQPLIVITPDHRTRPIRWSESSEVGEVFDLLRIRIEAPKGNVAVEAWLYIPHWSPHRLTPTVHEVLAPKLELDEQSQCSIIIDRKTMVLPYYQWQAILVV